MVHDEQEQMVLFNGGLNQPLKRREMQMLRPLGFTDLIRYAMNRPEPRVSVQSYSPSPLAAIPEGHTLQIGVVGLSSTTSLTGKRGRRESWGSSSEASNPEPAASFSSSLQPATRRVARLKK